MPKRLLITTLTTVVAAAVLAGGCRSSETGPGSDRLQVVATVPAVAQLAAVVGGADVEVTDLTPAGGEPHDLELSTDDVDRVDDADVVVYIGGGFQPAVERVVRGRKRAVDLLEVAGGDDPHVWLDPVRMEDAVRAIAGAFSDADPDHEDSYRQRADDAGDRLGQLDQRIRTGLADCSSKVLVITHPAFTVFAARYGLEQVAIAPKGAGETEPDAGRLADVADLVRSRQVGTVFGEPRGGRVAATVAREAGVATAELDPIERRTSDYFRAMDANLSALRRGLGCR